MNFLYSIFGLRKLLLICQNAFFNLAYRRGFKNPVTIYGLPIVVLFPKTCIENGRHFTLISSAYFSETGVNHPVMLRTLAPDARIVIGDNVGISGGGIVAAKEVVLGNNVMIGGNSFITDTDFHALEPDARRFNRAGISVKPVRIEDNVFIGMDCLILKGVTIGENSVIGAGSVVTQSIPADSVAAGNPARVIKSLKVMAK